MDSEKKYHELSTAWVNIWVGIGIGVIFILAVSLLLLGVLMSTESTRMTECEAGIRLDCDSSLIWALQGFSVREAVEEGVVI